MLGPRALNRALLARQMLLDRRPLPPEAAIEHFVGLQAQAPLAPYVGLWSRLADFDAAELSDAIVARRAVRTSLMRATIHLVTARDALVLRPLIQPVLERGFRASPFGQAVPGVDLGPILAAGRALLEERPRTNPELARSLSERWPDLPADSLVYAVGYLVPLVHVPPRGVWDSTGPVARTTMEHWLGRPLDTDPTLDDLILRYLGAFGPASVMDIRAWSGLTRLRSVVERLRPRLVTFRDEHERELFDLPDAPRPDAGTPAPPRFLPEYDNVLLGHADRSRIIPVGRRIPLPSGNGAAMGTILVDGMFAGTWRIARSGEAATLTIDPFEPIPPAERIAVEEEAARLLEFVGLAGAQIVVRAPTS
jgi:DNA glycosylase AlkZ-like